MLWIKRKRPSDPEEISFLPSENIKVNVILHKSERYRARQSTARMEYTDAVHATRDPAHSSQRKGGQVLRAIADAIIVILLIFRAVNSITDSHLL
ncbi:hypothetical protein KQX54_007839 [Cotesia glomerata]|uniref:Uncharacterized protein n=1 Tax=Cotesia glomerata TaxID=32391 RepID=A0AAV7IXJ6_COTGL|nr:hypothetical protein KQX54_007839 [Cotesia glomerata]